MPNQRKKDKKLVGFFADPLEYEAIQKLAKKHAVSVAELLRRIANGTIKLSVWVLGLGAAAALGLALGGAAAGGENARPQASTAATGCAAFHPVSARHTRQATALLSAFDGAKIGVAG